MLRVVGVVMAGLLLVAGCGGGEQPVMNGTAATGGGGPVRGEDSSVPVSGSVDGDGAGNKDSADDLGGDEAPDGGAEAQKIAKAQTQDLVAQSTARRALEAGRVHFDEVGNFNAATCLAGELAFCLEVIEMNLVFEPSSTHSTGPARVSVLASPSYEVAWYAVLSDTDTCFLIKDDRSSGPGSGVWFRSVLDAAFRCSAFEAAFAEDWSDQGW